MWSLSCLKDMQFYSISPPLSVHSEVVLLSSPLWDLWSHTTTFLLSEDNRFSAARGMLQELGSRWDILGVTIN